MSDLRKENEELRAKIITLEELNASLLSQLYRLLRDKKCSYCHKLVSDCDGDHGDDMRWEQREALRKSGDWYK